MSLRSHLMILAVVGLLVLLNTVAIEAQFAGRQQRGQQKPQTQPYTGKGTIDAIARGMIKMTSGTDSVVIQFPMTSKVRVLGTAQPDFLRPGQLIQFNATLDKKKGGPVEGEVKKLTIFTVSPDFTLGCMPEGGGGDTAATGIGLPAGKGKGKSKGEGAATADIGPKPYIVAGSIIKVAKSANGYKLTIRVPGVKGKVELEIAEGTQLDVNVADTSMVKQGDNIEVIQGQGMKMGTTMMVMANEARITMAAPLTGASKKGPHGKAGHAKKAEEGAASEPAGAAKPAEKDAKPADSK